MMKVPSAAAAVTTTFVSFLSSSSALMSVSRSSSRSVLLSSSTRRSMVSLHGDTTFNTTTLASSSSKAASNSNDNNNNNNNNNKKQKQPPVARRKRTTLGLHEAGQRPPDPQNLLTPRQLQEQQDVLINWFLQIGTWLQRGCSSDSLAAAGGVLCLTGAGLSTESGVPDYRGHNGSYHAGHKPVLHQEFMTSHHQRQRYWARGMIGWRSFANRQPAAGHAALAQLERLGVIGVHVQPDRAEFYKNAASYLQAATTPTSSDHRRLAVVTQNVDGLHRRAGSRQVLELHGRTDQLECMQCGHVTCRHDFHTQLEHLNQDWLQQQQSTTKQQQMRPDGDAAVEEEDFRHIQVPSCSQCRTGFFKPRVVFFGDSVPAHRVALCRAAVEQMAADSSGGLLVVGSSLAVHSAYRHVRQASQLGVPICILNVGETRAQAEGLEGNILHVQAPAGPTLQGVAEYFDAQQQHNNNNNQ